jgi:predicted nucleic-acid-binding Zn-ribbon protein
LEIKAPYVPPIIKPTPPTEEKTNWLPIAAGAIIALVAVAGIAAFAVSRRKSRGPPAPTSEEKAEMERKKALMPTWAGDQGAAGGAGGFTGGVVDRDLGRSGTAGYPAPSAETTPSGGRTSSCPKCGNEVEADADYCYTCGERWGKKGEKTAETDLYKTAPAPRSPPQPPSPPMEEAPVYTPEPAQQEIAEAQAVPVETPAAPSKEGDLDDILGQLQSMSAPAPAPPPRQPPARPAQPPAHTTVQARPAQAAVTHQAPRAAPPPPAMQPATTATAQTAATAQGGTGKSCPKCGKEMARLVELPGAQNEQLKRLNAKGQHAFQCRSCGHFEISKWP